MTERIAAVQPVLLMRELGVLCFKLSVTLDIVKFIFVKMIPAPLPDMGKVLVSQNIRSGRLRAFAFAGLESLCCSNPSLDV
ncbi:hypothetical protein V6N13_052773 [Hibiscus sabdariffa]